MLLIPVIDVKNRVAVRAVAGDRRQYRPLSTPLARSSVPEDVANGFMALHPFPVIYLADLDGIEGRGADEELPARIAAATEAEVWIDSGVSDAEAVARTIAMERVHAVLGSESGWTVERLTALPPHVRGRIVLSLDFRGDGLVGDRALLARPDVWPRRVVVMTLARVGTAGGPDLAQLADIADRARRTGHAVDVFAAGGVRDAGDLALLARCGVHGALIASALHAQTITASDLVRNRWPRS